MLFKQLPTATKICSATLTQVPKDQEKAVRDLGGGQLSILGTVILPGLKPAFLSCFVYNFSSSMTTAGAIIFLIDPARKLAVFQLFLDAVYTGEYALASRSLPLLSWWCWQWRGWSISSHGRQVSDVYLELSHLKKNFDGKQVVRDLSLTRSRDSFCAYWDLPVNGPGKDNYPEYDRRFFDP